MPVRVGKCWRHIDFNGDIRKLQRTVTLVELIPIDPEGWMIYEGGHPMYGKMVFNKISALNALVAKVKGIEQKKKLLKIEEIMWEEVPELKPAPQAAPDGWFPICKDLSDENQATGFRNTIKPLVPAVIEKEDLTEVKEKPISVLKKKKKENL